MQSTVRLQMPNMHERNRLVLAHLLDDWQDPWFCVIVTVRSDSLVMRVVWLAGQLQHSTWKTSYHDLQRERVMTHQIDLVRACVCPVSCHQTEERVLRRLRDSISWEAGRECRGRHLVGDAAYPVGGVGGRVVSVVSLGLGFVVGAVGRGRHPLRRGMVVIELHLGPQEK